MAVSRFVRDETQQSGMLTLDVYTVRQLSEALGISEKRIMRAVRAKELAARPLGGSAGTLIAREAVVAWLAPDL